MRVFVSAGEPSGELVAADLLAAMATEHGAFDTEGIGGTRLEGAGVRIVQRTVGWATLGPVEALANIPRMYVSMWRMASRIRFGAYDLVVLVDFGAFNLRLARSVRLLGSRVPIMYYFPPGAWLDDPRRARAVAALTEPLAAFAHQRDFYRSSGLPIGYAGHPLVSTI